MIYAAFALWLILALFMGAGVFRLLTAVFRPAWVSWALLPGTVVSEMAYILGSLITGGEIRSARLMSGGGKAAGQGGAEPSAEAQGGLKYIRPVVAAMLSIVACAAAIVGAGELLGGGVLREFREAGGAAVMLPQSLPASWAGFWDQMERQVQLLRRMFEAWRAADWLNWRTPVFIYFAACLSIRLGPVRRDPRSTLAAVVFVAALVAVVGAVSSAFGGRMAWAWPLLTYVWANLLAVLSLALMLNGIVSLVRVLSGRTGKKGA